MSGQKMFSIILDEVKEIYIAQKQLEETLERLKKLGRTLTISTPFIEIITDPDPKAKEKVQFD